MSSPDLAASSTAVRLAEQGHFWVGVTYEQRGGETVVDGTQLYVEFQRPEEQTQPYPVVLVHGGGGQGLDWMTTPDGRPGWRTLLLQRGFAVYTVDRPAHGRSPARPAASGPAPLTPSVERMGVMFAGAENPDHTQWPGSGRRDDPALGQFLAGSGSMSEPAADHATMRRRGAELLDRIGPAVVITNSAGGPTGWLLADERPDLVRAVIALEPMGPGYPFPLPWGITASPITYEPAVPPTGSLDLVDVPSTDGQPPMRLQPEPARRLPHLADLPIAVVTGEQSFAAQLDAGTVAFLRQAGCTQVEHLRLGELGIHGNGHLMMLERNNAEVLDAVLRWLDGHVDEERT